MFDCFPWSDCVGTGGHRGGIAHPIHPHVCYSGLHMCLSQQYMLSTLNVHKNEASISRNIRHCRYSDNMHTFLCIDVYILSMNESDQRPERRRSTNMKCSNCLQVYYYTMFIGIESKQSFSIFGPQYQPSWAILIWRDINVSILWEWKCLMYVFSVYSNLSPRNKLSSFTICAWLIDNRFRWYVHSPSP